MKILEKNTTEQFGFTTHEYIVEYFSDKYKVYHHVNEKGESFDMYSVKDSGENIFSTASNAVRGVQNVWYFSVKGKIIKHIKNISEDAQ